MTERLGPGSWYLYAPKYGALPHFFSFGSGRERAASERASALVRSASKQRSGSSDVLTSSTFNSSPSTYSLGAGAVAVVQPGLFDVGAGELLRVQPNVVFDADRNILCIFNGYLSNLDELAERYTAECAAGSPLGSPKAVVPPTTTDLRQLAAELMQRAYLKNRSADLLVLLSELQGQYSFVVYDGEKHCVFAARDSSGREPLFYEISEDNAVSLSNVELVVPVDGGMVEWAELPPGHYISGRTPKLGQFALTPEQLSIREYYETLTDEFEGASPRAAISYIDGMRSSESELDTFPALALNE